MTHGANAEVSKMTKGQWKDRLFRREEAKTPAMGCTLQNGCKIYQSKAVICYEFLYEFIMSYGSFGMIISPWHDPSPPLVEPEPGRDRGMSSASACGYQDG